MAGRKFVDLSYDMKAMIVSFVTRPTDMKALCLTSKELRDITVRRLYRKVEIDVGCEADVKLAAFLGRNNPGLEHIRILILNPSADEPPSPPPSPPSPPQHPPAPLIVMGGHPPPPPPPPPPMNLQTTRTRSMEVERRRWSPAHFTVRMILELLPENILEKFRWTSYDEFSVDNFILLCKKQRKLSCVEGGPTDRSLLKELEKAPNLLQRLEDLHALDLYPDSNDVLETCAKLIESTPKLDELWIESGFGISMADDSDDGQNYDDECNKPGLITTTLFRKMIPFQQCTPMTLKYLALGKMNLRWIAQTYMKIVDFPSLEELEVRNCPGSDALFAEMTKPAKLPTKLRSLKFAHSSDERPYALSALENFLRTISTLTKLYINFTGSQRSQPPPKIDSICNQGETLKALILHSSGSTQTPSPSWYKQEDIERLCKACVKLEQLAIGCPSTVVLDKDVSPPFASFTKSVLTLPELATFNITSWPESGSTFNVNNYHNALPSEVYISEIHRIAQWIFDQKLKYANHQKTFSKLRVVAFGGNVKHKTVPGVSETLPPLAYMPGQQVNPFGEKATVAVRLKQPSLVKYVEPDSEILSCNLTYAPR